MTQTELLTWLDEQTWCDAILDTPKVIGEPQSDGTQWCSVTIREVHDIEAITRRIHFYVVDKDTADERAYWKDATPTATLTPPESTVPVYKMITFRTLINALDGEMIASIMTKLKAVANQNVIIEQAYRMLETYGQDGGIDINSINTQLMIQSLVTAGVLTQAEADAVISLADADLRGE